MFEIKFKVANDTKEEELVIDFVSTFYNPVLWTLVVCAYQNIPLHKKGTSQRNTT